MTATMLRCICPGIMAWSMMLWQTCSSSVMFKATENRRCSKTDTTRRWLRSCEMRLKPRFGSSSEVLWSVLNGMPVVFSQFCRLACLKAWVPPFANGNPRRSHFFGRFGCLPNAEGRDGRPPVLGRLLGRIGASNGMFASKMLHAYLPFQGRP